MPLLQNASDGAPAPGGRIRQCPGHLRAACAASRHGPGHAAVTGCARQGARPHVPGRTGNDGTLSPCTSPAVAGGVEGRAARNRQDRPNAKALQACAAPRPARRLAGPPRLHPRSGGLAPGRLFDLARIAQPLPFQAPGRQERRQLLQGPLMWTRRHLLRPLRGDCNERG